MLRVIHGECLLWLTWSPGPLCIILTSGGTGDQLANVRHGGPPWRQGLGELPWLEILQVCCQTSLRKSKLLPLQLHWERTTAVSWDAPHPLPAVADLNLYTFTIINYECEWKSFPGRLSSKSLNLKVMLGAPYSIGK